MSVCLLEHDFNGDTLAAWTYPGVTAELQTLCIDKFNHFYSEKEAHCASFLFFKIKGDWVYIVISKTRKDVSTEVVASALCLVAKVFSPEKFRALLALLHEQYLSSGDPTKILEGYLSVYTSQKFKSFNMSKYQDSDAYLSSSCIKDIVRMIGLESVVLWNAVLLKKRILVIDTSGPQNLSKLLDTVRTLPQLAFHRQDWSILRPLISIEGDADETHIEDLKNCGVFIAGAMDGAVAATYASLFDVVFSLTDHRVTISDEAAPSMRMGATHRELAQQLVDLEENPTSTSEDMLKVIVKKTEKVIKNLKSLIPEGESKLTEEIINENVSNESTQQWLARIAIAEGLL